MGATHKASRAGNAKRAALALPAERRVLELLSEGKTYQQIADTCKAEGHSVTSTSGVAEVVRRGLARANPHADQIRQEQMAKASRQETELAGIFLDTNRPVEERLKAHQQWLRVMGHVARISGLHTTRVIVEEYTADSLNRELAAMLQGAALAKDMQDAAE